MQREFVVLNKLGIHARPAAMFVKVANRFTCSYPGRKGRRKGQRQEHHGPDDAGRRPRQQTDRHLRRRRLPRRRWTKSKPSSNANSTKTESHPMPGNFDVKYVAHLARIALTPAEERKIRRATFQHPRLHRKAQSTGRQPNRADRPRRPAGQRVSPRRSPPFAAQRGGAAQRPRPGQRLVHGSQNRGVTAAPCSTN